MASENRNISVGKKGMNRDAHPSNLSESEYSYALNTNYEDTSGNGLPNLQNENSNILCTRFKPGYKVLGFRKDLNEDKTYFFLTNPTTGVSEIGYISDLHNVNSVEDVEANCGCDVVKILSEPLENVTQIEGCTYTTLIADNCNSCLNFNINFPIREGNIQLKDEKCGKRLYWTDNYNPPRYLELDNLDQYQYDSRVPCTDDQVSNCTVDQLCIDAGCADCTQCIDCDKLRVFPLYNIPCLLPASIQFGGNLRAGTYEFLIAYCNKNGDEITQYFSITNPISIFDANKRTSSQPELADRTNLGIRIDIEGLDNTFEYYKIAVIQNADVNQVISYFVEGIHPLNETSIYYYSELSKLRTTIDQLNATKPTYNTTGIMTSSNGYLFQADLTSEKEYNLQPVVNLMGAFLEWQTVASKEDMYSEGLNTSLYRSHLRDEVYPYSVRFQTDKGYETALFPFVARPAIPTDVEIVANTDISSVNAFAPVCSDSVRQHRWQYYNTATKEGVCDALGFNSITKSISKYCEINSVATAPAQCFDVISPEVFNSVEQFIDTKEDEICDPASEFHNAELCGYLTDTYPGDTCTPTTEDGCTGVYVHINDNIVVDTITNGSTTIIPKLAAEYESSVPPVSCSIFVPRPSKDNEDKLEKYYNVYILDDDFKKEYVHNVPIITERVFYRNNVGTNISCARAAELPPNANYYDGTFFDYFGTKTTPNALLTTLDSAAYVGAGYAFNAKLHVGALWYEATFGERSNIVFEITEMSQCERKVDSVSTATHVRYSVYDSCVATTPVLTGIVDLEDGVLVDFPAVLFPSGSAFIAVDCPIEYQNSKNAYIVTPPCGCIGIVDRGVEVRGTTICYDSITIDKQQEYTTECDFITPDFSEISCAPINYEYGKFGYYESTDTYPDNRELYDSSTLDINESDIPASIKGDFDTYFMDSVDGNGDYTLKAGTNLACAPIRHYRFPDSEVAPFMFDGRILPFQETLVFPIGVRIDNEVINAFLDLAVKNNLLTQEKRDSLVGYEVFRGDRSIHRSILAKGLLFDTLKYTEADEEWLYPNYPYNDLGEDVFNYTDETRSDFIPHPYGGDENRRFTFHSPDFHFRPYKNVSEMKIEGYEFGNSRGRFVDVEGHPKWVLLGDKSYTAANVLAAAEIAFEEAIKLGDYLIQSSSNYTIGVTGNPIGVTIATGAVIALGVAQAVASATFRFGRARYEWLKILNDNGAAKNFASYYTSEGFYNYFQPQVGEGNKLRGLAKTVALKDGNYKITEDTTGNVVSFNNTDREYSVYLSLGDDYPLQYTNLEYVNHDNNGINPGVSSRFDSPDCSTGRGVEHTRNIASMYVSLKNYIPNQYGKLESIQWLPTGYCGDLTADNACEAIFGGDTFITRFALKRKMPFFYVDAFELADRTPFTYSYYRNVGHTRYYVDHMLNDREPIINAIFPDLRSNYELDCTNAARNWYVEPPAKFYLYSYGIPQFLVESEINCNFRYGGVRPEDNFYPNVGDYVSWTQQQLVPIRAKNVFKYNEAYSKLTSRVSARTLPATYNKELYDCAFDSDNGVIYSLQDNSEVDFSDPWLVYRPYDAYQFPTSAGKLIDLRDIESSQILGRFENQVMLFNAIDQIRERLTPETAVTGTGGIFSTRPLEFKKTDLGYAGTQHKAMASCEFGHFWADAKRGQIFRVDMNGKDLKEVTMGMRNWFKEHLPFKILKSNITNLTDSALDNNFKGLGITMGWDSRFKRVFLTKKDYIVKTAYAGQVSYDTTEMVGGVPNPNYKEFVVAGEIVLLQDTTIFEDVSFTVAYSPITESWMSYYSFKPDYYISHHNYFQTGLNYASDSTEEGLWSHLLTNKSYKVFYGKKYPWTIELAVKNEYTNKIVESIHYWMDSRRYHNEYDFAEKRNVGFNRAWVYNQSNNSGQLNLAVEQKNNMFQKLQYPKIVNGTQDILATENDKMWSFNYFYNQVRNELNNQPIWLNDRNVIDKTLNSKAITYNQAWKDRLRGDWFTLRLSEDETTQYKQIFKWSASNENMY